MSWGKCKLKQQWDTTTYLLERPKSGTPTAPNASENVEQQELSMLARMHYGSATLKDCLAVFYKTKHTLTIQLSNLTLWCLPNGAENFNPYKSPHMDIYSSFIHNWRNLESTKMSFSRQMDKQTVAHTVNRTLFSDKKYWASKQWKEVEKTYMLITEVTCMLLIKQTNLKRLHVVGFQLFDILILWFLFRMHKSFVFVPIIWHFEKGKTMVAVKWSVVSRG